MTMTRGPDRKPSTLAANRAIAATRPIPIPPAKKPTDGKLSVQEIARDLARNPVVRGTNAAAANAAAPKPLPVAEKPVAAPARAGIKKSAKPAVKVEAEQRIVFTVVVCFLVCVATLVAVRVGDNMQASKAKVAIEATFNDVHLQQQNFRVLNSRFATWNELAATGATLPPYQSVAASNADASHWYLSLRDQKTGVVCDRTGELFDESADERKPVCRSK